MKTKACIFDLDGVLVDTAVYHYAAWKRLANGLGFDFTEAQNEHLKGVGRMNSLDMILNWGGVEKTQEEKEALATQKNNWYVDMINKMGVDEVLPGSVQLLENLRKAGFKVALGSVSKNSSIILARTGLAHLFDVIVDGNIISNSKPDPEVFLKGSELLGIAPADCLVFEDAQAGVEAALTAKMKVVGVGQAENLKGVDRCINNLSEISVDQIITLLDTPKYV